MVSTEKPMSSCARSCWQHEATRFLLQLDFGPGAAVRSTTWQKRVLRCVRLGRLARDAQSIELSLNNDIVEALLIPAGPDDGWAPLDILELGSGNTVQLVDMGWAVVGERIAPEPSPQVLHPIEVRAHGGKNAIWMSPWLGSGLVPDAGDAPRGMHGRSDPTIPLS